MTDDARARAKRMRELAEQSEQGSWGLDSRGVDDLLRWSSMELRDGASLLACESGDCGECRQCIIDHTYRLGEELAKEKLKRIDAEHRVVDLERQLAEARTPMPAVEDPLSTYYEVTDGEWLDIQTPKTQRFALLCVWSDGAEEFVRQGNRVAMFSSKSRAEKHRDNWLEGIADEVQSINVVPYPQPSEIGYR